MHQYLKPRPTTAQSSTVDEAAKVYDFNGKENFGASTMQIRIVFGNVRKMHSTERKVFGPCMEVNILFSAVMKIAHCEDEKLDLPMTT